MHLAAIYFEEATFLGEKILIKFGGNYDYWLENEKICIAPKSNILKSFYSNSPLEMISAIAGKNGAGKTTLLKEITRCLSMPDAPYQDNSVYAAIFEEDDQLFFKGNPAYIDTPGLLDNVNIITDTIYYSPHQDFNVNSNGIDISLDKWLFEDLQNYSQYLFEYSGEKIFRYLHNQSIKRQIEFIASPKSKIISKEFNLPNYTRIRLTLPSIKVSMIDGKEIDYNNTPTGFHDDFNRVLSKIKSENLEIGKSKDRASVIGQKRYMKNYLLTNFIHLLINKLEENNFALEEGYIPDLEELESYSALKHVFYLIDSHYFQKGSQKWDISLPKQISKKLLNTIYQAIDNCDFQTGDWEWSDRSFVVGSSEAIKILEIQEEFLNELDSYNRIEYDFNKEKINASYNPYKGLVNFEPSDRKLSSGEQSLLNLYSRLHAYLNDNFKKTQTRAKAELYLILLDEADLGFHPEWKKRYVKSITSFFQEYFDEFESKCQIVLSTHSPYSLSDLFSDNVILCKNEELQGFKVIDDVKLKTFSANIHELLAHSFFLEGGTIGQLAKEKLEDLIEFLNDKNNHEHRYWTEEICRVLIDEVGDTIIKERLYDLFKEKYNIGISLEEEEKRLIDRLNEIQQLKKR